MKRKLLQRLVGPSTVLCIRFGDAENYAMRLFVLGLDRSGLRILRECADPDADALKKECSGRPVLISVSGYGIVTKPTEDTAIVEKVTSDPETFAWSFSDEKEDSGSISFVRREQVEPLGQRLAENGIPVRFESVAHSSGPCLPPGKRGRTRRRSAPSSGGRP